MYERDDPESSTELSSSGPSAERASDASSSILPRLFLFLFLLSVGSGRGLLLPLFLPTERHAPLLLLPSLVPVSPLSSSPLLRREGGKLGG